MEKVKLKDVGLTILEIWKGGQGNPFDTVELNRDSRRFIKIEVNNRIKTYEDGKLTRKESRFPLKICNENNFKTSFE